MFDRRVVRGPTFRSKTDLSASVTQLNPQHKASSSSAIKASSARPAKPLPVLPSSSASIVPLTSTVTAQTDDYLEELTDEIFEQENATQTDAALLPPPPPRPSPPSTSPSRAARTRGRPSRGWSCSTSTRRCCPCFPR